MKVSIAIRCTYKENGADRVARVARVLDTDSMREEEMRQDFLLTFKESLIMIKKKGVDLGITAEDFDKFFEEVF